MISAAINPRALVDRFPALAQLGLARRAWEMPAVVLQLAATDCGAACLAMVLAFQGREVRLEDVRTAMDVGRDGVSAHAIVDTAAAFGLRGRGVRIEPADLASLPPATVLHWNLSHFVVFERLTPDGAEIVDPAVGRRTVSHAELDQSLSGVALVFEKANDFIAAKKGTGGGGGRGRPVWRYLRAAIKDSPEFRRVLLLSIVLQVFGLSLPLINGRIVDRVLPRNDIHLMLVLVGGLVITLVFTFFGSMVRSHMLLNLRTQIDAGLTLGFFDHMLRLPLAFFQRRSTGDLLMRLNSNSALRDLMTSSVLSGLLDSTLVVAHLIFLVAISRTMALAAVLLVALQGLFLLLTRKRQLELATGSLTKQAASESYLIEVMEGIETLKTAGLEHRAVEQWSTKYVDVLNLAIKTGEWAAWSNSLSSVLRMSAPFVLLIVGTMQVLDRSLSLGTMLSAQAFAVGFLGPVTNLAATFASLQIGSSYIARIDEVMSMQVEQPQRSNNSNGNSNKTDAVLPAHKLRGEIRLEHVSFRYNTGSKVVLADVSLHIQPGQFIAIVGRSGSGKSTLASLLLRMHPPSSGRITFDGRDLSAIDVGAVRRQIGVVNQKPHVFGSTVRANIALAVPEASGAEVESAARLAGIHEDIAQMPMGYDTPLTAGGGALSGGQRQRIALARAIMTRPAVLLLDEATSALDAVTEREVFSSIEQWPCTRVVIAHRLSTVVRADVIVVMEGGRIVETGTHDELLARGQHYEALVRAQLGRRGADTSRSGERAVAAPPAPAAVARSSRGASRPVAEASGERPAAHSSRSSSSSSSSRDASRAVAQASVPPRNNVRNLEQARRAAGRRR